MQEDTNLIIEKTKSLVCQIESFLHGIFIILLKVVEAVVIKECKDVLTREMHAINVDFRFFEEYNQLAEKKKTETKWTSLDGNLI